MQASQSNILNIIEGTKQYIVPLFQRPYSWSKNEWSTLWNDLTELCITENPRPHFLGSLVTMQVVTVPEGVAKYTLIDGQQRLTTLFILLAAIRDYAATESNKELADEIKLTLLVNQFKSGDDYFKLMPTQDDRESFQNLINHDAPTEDENKITCAYMFYLTKLKKDTPDLYKLKDVITKSLIVVSVVLDVNDNPHLVFEGLNAKGRPLTQADLIRNYLLMKIHIDKQADVYKKYWKPMQDSLQEDITEFIRHYLISDGSEVKQGDIYYCLKERVSANNAIEYLAVLSKFSMYYEKLLFQNKEPNKQIEKRLDTIRKIEMSTSYPFLLRCYEDYNNKALSASDFIEILDTLINFSIRRYVCNVPTNELNKIFPPLYDQIRALTDVSFVQGFKNILQRKNYPRDLEFKNQLMNSRLYGRGNKIARTKLLLDTIEMHYGHKETVDLNKLTIEHVMPQTLSEEWQRELDKNWEETHELYLHTLGNLTLTAYNSELQNYNFKKKKETYIESHLELNKFFGAKENWSQDRIIERGEMLADILLEIWPYFGESQGGITNSNNVTGTNPRELHIFGQIFFVKNWRDVMEKSLNIISELEPDKFNILLSEYPKFLSLESKRMRATRLLNKGVFIEVNLSAQSIYKFCNQAFEAIGLTAEDWKVVYES